MSENLKLPICPKCNDTKNVYEMPAVRLVTSYSTEYSCSECKIKWRITLLGNGCITKQDKYDLIWQESVK